MSCLTIVWMKPLVAVSSVSFSRAYQSRSHLVSLVGEASCTLRCANSSSTMAAMKCSWLLSPLWDMRRPCQKWSQVWRVRGDWQFSYMKIVRSLCSSCRNLETKYLESEYSATKALVLWPARLFWIISYFISSETCMIFISIRQLIFF